MTLPTVAHDTFVIERIYNVPPAGGTRLYLSVGVSRPLGAIRFDLWVEC